MFLEQTVFYGFKNELIILFIDKLNIRKSYFLWCVTSNLIVSK